MAALYDEGLLSYDARFNQPLICLTHLLLGPLTHSLIAPKYMTQNTPIPTILSMEVFVLLANQWKCGLSLSHGQDRRLLARVCSEGEGEDNRC